MKTLRLILFASIALLLIVSCKKTVEKFPEKKVEGITQPQNISTNGGGSALALTNANLLYLVISGQGGYVQGDTASEPGPVDTWVLFPSYASPSNVGGMLHFPSMEDYNKFMEAANLMEDLWIYPDTDFEDTPEEINHLGIESFNALDSALGFQSLRHKYDLNEFYNHDWADTASLYVEDEEYETVLNQNHEFKIGNKFYKYISDIIIAVINNSNQTALNFVRQYGILAVHPDITFFNENIEEFEEIFRVEEPTGCDDFKFIASAINLTPLSSTSNQWEVELSASIVITDPTLFNIDYSPVKANYTVNWGDGSSSNFIGYFAINNRIRHIYSQIVPPGTSVVKNITVTCQLIYPQPPSFALYMMLLSCPAIQYSTYTSFPTVRLSTPATGDCMGRNIKREFYGISQLVNGKEYRLECKIKQKTRPLVGFPHVKVIAHFTKRKNNSWKSCRSVGSIILRLRGAVFNENTCSSLFTTIFEEKTKSKRKELKIKTADVSLPSYFNTRKSLPLAINGDFIWTYNGTQVHVGNYNEVLKP